MRTSKEVLLLSLIVINTLVYAVGLTSVNINYSYFIGLLVVLTCGFFLLPLWIIGYILVAKREKVPIIKRLENKVGSTVLVETQRVLFTIIIIETIVLVAFLINNLLVYVGDHF